MSEISLLEQYKYFKPAVDAIREDETDAFYVGDGAESIVWKASVDDREYAIKFIKKLSPRGRPRNIERAVSLKMKSGYRGIGIRGLEQIRAASIDEGIVIYDFATGINVKTINEEQLSIEIDPNNIEDLKQTVSVASQRGIEFDGWNSSGANVFYDPTLGFTVIDYLVAERLISYEVNYKNLMKSMGTLGVKLALQKST